jgi:hypothetical protein
MNFDFPSPEIRDRLTAWWNFEEQEHPYMIGTVCDGPLPDTDDLERFWADEEFVIERKMAELERLLPAMKEGGGYIFATDHSIPSNLAG